MNEEPSQPEGTTNRPSVFTASSLRLAGFSFLLLFFEIALIRFVPANVQVVSYFINLILISAFLGFGVGMILQQRDMLPWFAPNLTVLLGVVAYFANAAIEATENPDEYLWSIPAHGSSNVDAWGMEPVVFMTFALSTLVFMPLGAGIAREFGKFRPLLAYSINVAGSLLGLAAFSFLSWLSIPPILWFATGLVIFAALVFKERRAFVATALVSPVVLFLVVTTAQTGNKQTEVWSPYYKINFSRFDAHMDLRVNGSFHQHALNFSAHYVETDKYIKRVRADYVEPYEFARSLDDVLILGSGTGNDVAIALQLGAGRIDAVEIDPEIIRLGKEHHYQKPYSDRRVSVFTDDARAFLKKSKKRYDAVVLGTLDSQTLLSSMSSIRLDNYVYTVESFRSIKDHLKPGGVLILYHMSGRDYIAEKIFYTLATAFEENPLMKYTKETHLFNFTFVSGWSGIQDEAFWARPDLPVFKDTFVSKSASGRQLPSRFKIPTDEWPYLYLKNPTVPAHYLQMGGLLLLFAVLLVAWAARGRGRAKHKPDWVLFFLGAGFLLMETKSVTEMSLLFGSTWIVNVLVFSSILLMVLFANWFVIKGRVRNENILFVLLIATLLLCYSVQVEWMLGFPLAVQWLTGSLLVALPIFFAGILFAVIFRTRQASAVALGYNVLGSVLGGLLEYNAMVLGTKSLYLVAIALYAVAYYLRRRENTPNRCGVTESLSQGEELRTLEAAGERTL